MVAEKTETVAQLTAAVKGSSGVYLADFTGLTVDKVTALRRNLTRKGIRMRVAKNTLIRRALADAGVKGLDNHLAGPTAVILADAEDPITPARMLVDFLKENEKALSLKAVHIDGQAYGGEQLASLAKTPGKRELQAQVITLAMGAGANLLSLFKGPASKLAGQIKALAEKLEKGDVPSSSKDEKVGA